MKMYDNFTLDEFTKSDTARRLHIDNAPPVEAVCHIGELVGGILQPLREAWGGPIHIKSGYRCKALNDAIPGSSKTSAHLMGWAADCVPENMMDFDSFCDFTREFVKAKKIPFDQIIIESSGGARWLHIAVRDQKARQRGMLFRMDL